jgi:hypothetical protein
MIRPLGQAPHSLEMVTLSDGGTVWRADCDSEPRILSASNHVVLVSGTGRPGYGVLDALSPEGGQRQWKVDLEAELRHVGEVLPDSGPRIVGAAIVVGELVYVAMTGRLVPASMWWTAA